MRQRVILVSVWLCAALSLAGGWYIKAQSQDKAQTQDAAALEAQYKTCAKHYIPADKCTPEIYRQLKEKDEALLDPKTSAALAAVKEYQKKLKSQRSMEVQTAYVTDKGDVCLQISGQNTLGGTTVDRVVLRADGKWRDGSGFFASMGDDAHSHADGSRDYWYGVCTRGLHQKMVPGTDVTEKVNQALKAESQ